MEPERETDQRNIVVVPIVEEVSIIVWNDPFKVTIVKHSTLWVRWVCHLDGPRAAVCHTAHHRQTRLLGL